MKTVRRISAIILVIMTITACFAVGFDAATVYSQDGFYYSRTSNKTADLYGRSTTDADLVIPKEFSEYYVTNVVDSAFEDDQNIETVTFGDAILLERIGYYAFKNCIKLKGQVNFGGRINTIGTSAFEDCGSLETVVFNAYVKEIPDQCFYNCTSLSTVVMNDRIESIGKFAFGNCASLKEITIPDSVKSISASAFSGCDDLVIYCNTDSYAHEYAVANEIPFVLLDAPVEVTFILGDADNSGNVDVVDATFAQRYVTHAEIPEDILDGIEMRADVDDTGELDSVDVTLLMRHLIRVKTLYPIGETVSRII